MELQHRNDGNCLKDNGEMESCSVQAMDIQYPVSRDTDIQYLGINWDSTTCSRDGGQSQITFLREGFKNSSSID